jgi:ubiquinone/menaquinone biosynthesis C-methylase UbiE
MVTPLLRAWSILLAIALCAAAPAGVSAQLGSRPAEEWIKTLDGPARVAALKVDEVVAAMKLTAGQTVADIGAGSGLLVVPIAKAVGPTGRVFAVEVDEAFLPVIRARAKEAGLANVQTVLGRFTDPALPSRAIDVAIFHDVLHHVEARAEYLKTLTGYLAPAGRVVVVDYEGGRGPHSADPALQVSREALTAMAAAAGLVQVDEAKLFADKYVLTFARRH